MWTIGSQTFCRAGCAKIGIGLVLAIGSGSLVADDQPKERTREERSRERQGNRRENRERSAPRQAPERREAQQQRAPGAAPQAAESGGRRGGGTEREANRQGDRRANPGEARSSGRTYRTRNGAEIQYRSNGQVASVRRGDMTIQRGNGNSRRIVVQRPDRTVIVTNRSGHGFVQRPFSYRGQPLVNRTYYLRGRTYSRYYRPYSYFGVSLNSYVPVRFYTPGFYGWFGISWGAPVYYPWGWNNAPWYGRYRGYFTPAPYYSSPAYWLTDYMLAARLEEAYMDGGPPPPSSEAVMMSPEVKEAIAQEVQRQLALERQEAEQFQRNEMPDPQAGFPRILSDNDSHVFVLSYTLDVNDSSGRMCTVSRGDVLRLLSPPRQGAPSGSLRVIASKPGSCPTGAVISVGVEDLQDMYNQMRETVSQGMEEMRSKSGQNGVPRLPPDAAVAPRNPDYMESAPPPDPQVASELRREADAADRLEREVGDDRPADSNSPVVISVGQSTDEVIGLMGNPRQIVNLTNRQIYIYPQMKITFVGGKVSDVQ